METIKYIHLSAGQVPPIISCNPFKAVVIVEETIEDEWRYIVSEWLVRTGCLFMMAWGLECSAWDDSVDHANLTAFNYQEIPDDKFVLTSWHENEPLSEVLWFAANGAWHPDATIEHTLLLHIAVQERQDEILKAYHLASSS